MNGYASNIRVTLHEDGSSITIEDDGRGIPVDKHPTTKKSALEVIFTVLHAGGKFEHGNYKTAGGLHGVGASVVNALSKELVATVKRDGAQWEMRSSRASRPARSRSSGRRAAAARRCTSIPTPTIFPKIEFDPAMIRERLEVASYLHKGLKVVVRGRDHEDPQRSFEHAEGHRRLPEEDRRRARRQAGARRAVHVDKDEGLRLDLVLQWTEATDEHIRSLRERHPDRLGRHARERPARRHRQGGPQLHRDAQPLAEGRDAHRRGHPRGLTGVLSVFIAEPQFQGQTKDRLNNPELRLGRRRPGAPGARALAEPQHQRRRGDRRAHHPRGARARGEPRGAAGGHAQERDVVAAEPAGQAERLHQLRRATSSELFIVEGDSAGGSAKQGRDRARQAILPLRGKVLNTESASLAKVLENKELSDLVTALGCGIGKNFDLVEAALRQGHHPGRRRFGRPPHRDAAAHVHLPSHAAADRRRQGLPRAAAALPHRHRQGDATGRSTTRRRTPS